ncbi:MAG: hypothetical protein AAFQ18_01710, partial [Pseudomonadota bacterium]
MKWAKQRGMDRGAVSGACPADPVLAGEHRPGPVYPEPHTFTADVDAALMQQALDTAKRRREPGPPGKLRTRRL